MNILVDDIGSFPLPPYLTRETFDKAYFSSRKAILEGRDITKDRFLFKNFYQVVVDSFLMKLRAGLDVANYPQHYHMHRQFAEVIHDAMDKGTYLVDEKDAVIPEVQVIRREAKELSEKIGSKVSLRVCVTGPFELYLKEVGTTEYRDVLSMFAENTRSFAKNSIINSKYIRTEVVALDEPSLGFQNVTDEKDLLVDIYEKAFNFTGVSKHIHLHSTAKAPDVSEVENLEVLSFEYAASPKNIENVSKSMLEKTDKQIRIGISRTDIDSILAELHDKGITKPSIDQLVENVKTIRKRFLAAKEKYGELMTFAGPDCGLGGWPSQAAAQLVLKRTVDAVRSSGKCLRQ